MLERSRLLLVFCLALGGLVASCVADNDCGPTSDWPRRNCNDDSQAGDDEDDDDDGKEGPPPRADAGAIGMGMRDGGSSSSTMDAAVNAPTTDSGDAGDAGPDAGGADGASADASALSGLDGGPTGRQNDH